MNHWDTKCTTCGHRKGNHQLNYGAGISGLKSIGHCVVRVGEERNYIKDVCPCEGFSDGKTWQNGKRV